MRDLRRRAGARIGGWRPEVGDALLYAGSAVFALLTAAFSTISLYRVWGQLAVGVYVAAALVSLALARTGRPPAPRPVAREAPPPAEGTTAWRRSVWSGRWRPARVWVFAGVLAGATLFPLAIEVSDRGGPTASAHVQPEVTVIEQAAGRLAQGKDPYHAEVRDGRVVSAVPGEPAYEVWRRRIAERSRENHSNQTVCNRRG